MGVQNIATSGLKAALTNMEAISNNIANVNSVGYKKSFVNFSDIYMGNVSSSNKQAGFGTRINSVQQDFSTGRIESTTNGLDLRLARDGFFVQKNLATGLTSYTRAGRLNFNKEGYLSSMGGDAIQGYPAIDGKIVASGNLVDLKIPRSSIPAQATTKVDLSLNLNSDSEIITAPFDSSDPLTYNYRSDQSIYDSLGNKYLMSLYYVKNANNTWNTQILVDNNNIGTGNVLFTDTGGLSSVTGLTGLSFNPGNGAASPQAFDINLANSTQYAGENRPYNQSPNGCPSGEPLGCSIGSDGQMNVYYSNGISRVEGQIAVAQFRSTQGLAKSDNMSWLETSDSGSPIIDPQYSQGAVISNSIEISNVDLTEELVKLIGAQHDFQANAQVQQTYNQILQTIENL